MGPQATIDLFQKVVNLTPAIKDQEHIPLLIYNYPQIPDRTSSIVSGDNSVLPYLKRGAQVLVSAGVSAIALACNTAHFYLPRFKEELNIYFIDMISLTRKHISDKQITESTAILATYGTNHTRLYHKALEDHVSLVELTWSQQAIVNDLIYQIKSGTTTKQSYERWVSLIEDLDSHNLILACIELPIIHEHCEGLYGITKRFINPTQLLAQEIIKISNSI